MSTIKKQLRTVYNSIKNTQSKDCLEYFYGYARGIVMAMLTTEIINIDGYDKYTTLLEKTYKTKILEVK